VEGEWYSLTDFPARCRSAADAIPQVKYPATLNHDGGILQELLRVDGPK
jgi:hypothetical protein